ncbi:MAG: hypothetical protein LBD16_01055 [Oscillospiraceae bacterium]|jgi:flotillin|nr:hypothetical protein [Oscillospiraceae bacterium]
MEDWTSFLVPALTVVGAFIVLYIFIFLTCYRVARIDQALIITGGRKPKIRISGGSIVLPIIRKAHYFDLCMLTIKGDNDQIITGTGVPIVVNWTAQIRPDTNERGILMAATSFLERGGTGIQEDIKLTLDGGVREVVASMTPEQVLREKEAFSANVKKSVTEEMANMGYLLVSLNIQDVTDKFGYFENVSAKDKEAKRREAANILAEANQSIRERAALSDQSAKEAELKAELSIAERQRDNALKMAEMKVETERAEADASVAGPLQAATRQKELTTQEGQIEVTRQEQAALAAKRRAEVIQTEAEAERRKREIEADAAAAVREKEAQAKANADKTEAEGLAAALKAQAEAESERIARTGKAEADVIKQKGDAEASAILAKAKADAEGERLLADARAANEGVNYKITIAEIEAKAKIEIATATATIMAEVGKNARFVNFGGGSGDKGNVLFDTLLNVPALIEKLNVTNQAVNANGEDFNETLKQLVSAVASPVGEAFHPVKDGKAE